MDNLLSIGDLEKGEIVALLEEAVFWKGVSAEGARETTLAPFSVFENKHILIVGDILHSRVARSNLELLTKLGARVTFVAPTSLLPADLSALPPVAIEHDFDAALKRADYDAIMLLRIQSERMLGGAAGPGGSENAGFFPSLVEYVEGYGLTNDRFRAVDPKIPVLHPAPINRGLEISSEIADSKQSLINHQIKNGVFVRAAALNMLVGETDARPLKPLAGRTIVNLFYENSTRTRFSFEVAEKLLGANIMNFSPGASSVTKGESLKDTLTTLYSLGIDGIVIRHQDSGAAKRIATSNWIPKTPILNAGDGTHAHPTQALLDALTLWEHFSGVSQIHGTATAFGEWA